MRTRSAKFVTFVAAFCAAVLSSMFFASPAQATTGVLCRADGSCISIGTGSPTQPPGRPNYPFATGGPYGGVGKQEDIRSSWWQYRLDDTITSRQDYVDAARKALSYPSQVAPANGSRGNLVHDGVGGPPCGTWNTCDPNYSRASFDGSLNQTLARDGSGQSGKCFGPRAWVIGRRVSESQDARDRYKIMHASRVDYAQQCSISLGGGIWTTPDYQLNAAQFPCTQEGGGYWASIGYIYNNEQFETTFDDQNWIWWSNQVSADPSSPLTFSWNELWIPETVCPKAPTIVNHQRTIKVGESATINLRDGHTCPQPATGSVSCGLVDANAFGTQFRNAAGSRLNTVGLNGGVLTFKGAQAGSFSVPYQFTNTKGTRSNIAYVTVNVISADPVVNNRTVQMFAGGPAVTKDLFTPGSNGDLCPSGYTCNLDTSAFRSAFATAARGVACIDGNAATATCNTGGVDANGMATFRGLTPGSFTVVYKVSIPGMGSDTARLTVNVVPKQPSAPNITINMHKGQTKAFASLLSGCPSGYTCSIVNANSVAYTFNADSNKLCLSNAQGTCTNSLSATGGYIHAGNWEGTRVMRFQVRENAGGATASGTVTVKVTALKPTPRNISMNVPVGMNGIVDLYNPATDCPVGNGVTGCELVITGPSGILSQFGPAAGNPPKACIDGFDNGGAVATWACGNQAAYPDGKVLIRGLVRTGNNPIKVNYTLRTNWGDVATGVLTVNVIDQPPVPDQGSFRLAGDVIITKPEVGHVGGSLDPTSITAHLDRIRFTECPTGYSCTVNPPNAVAGTVGYAVSNVAGATGQVGVTLAGDYAACTQPHQCDVRANNLSGTLRYGTANKTTFQFQFYRATRPGEPYTVTANATMSVRLYRFQFDYGCNSAGECSAVATVDPPGAPIAVTLTPVYPTGRSLPVIGSNLS